MENNCESDAGVVYKDRVVVQYRDSQGAALDLIVNIQTNLD